MKGIVLAGGTGSRLDPITRVACLEEIAYRRGYIALDSLVRIVGGMPQSGYRDYLERVIVESSPGT